MCVPLPKGLCILVFPSTVDSWGWSMAFRDLFKTAHTTSGWRSGKKDGWTNGDRCFSQSVLDPYPRLASRVSWVKFTPIFAGWTPFFSHSPIHCSACHLLHLLPTGQSRWKQNTSQKAYEHSATLDIWKLKIKSWSKILNELHKKNAEKNINHRQSHDFSGMWPTLFFFHLDESNPLTFHIEIRWLILAVLKVGIRRG